MTKKTIETSKNKGQIVVLWTAPRSVSTAFEKTFSQRPDTAIIDEPFLDVYYFSKWRCSNRFGDYDRRQDYQPTQVLEEIKSKTEAAPLVFMKEMAYQGLPYIDQDFIASAINTFIVRHPQEVMASWYRVNESPTKEEFGFDALKQMWQIVTEQLEQKPILVEANSFRRHPQKVLSEYCQRIGVKFYPQMLSWNEDKWRECQPDEMESRAKWYKTLDGSSGIVPPTKEKVEIRPEDVGMVEGAQKVYEELSDFAII
ncbi:sulfotransferase family protein [Moorena producens PAL-8-15-08-1]|uniref:Sulfotransferase family protein n=1 Tax=Moorena producens PAL-8-15-08-1 TaxID=1458985 RepID=A0A1D8U2G7_9CYAN|nr:sulfotransferase family protein [Moorena producens]AOX03896.1 sulfotransferase family protein [Moorena producens PAL-8-15-08-1]